jgi:hypothetical protein
MSLPHHLSTLTPGRYSLALMDENFEYLEVLAGGSGSTPGIPANIQAALDQKVAIAALNALVSTYLTSLPTTSPGAPGQLWINGGFLAVSL